MTSRTPALMAQICRMQVGPGAVLVVAWLSLSLKPPSALLVLRMSAKLQHYCVGHASGNEITLSKARYFTYCCMGSLSLSLSLSLVPPSVMIVRKLTAKSGPALFAFRQPNTLSKTREPCLSLHGVPELELGAATCLDRARDDCSHPARSSSAAVSPMSPKILIAILVKAGGRSLACLCMGSLSFSSGPPSALIARGMTAKLQPGCFCLQTPNYVE